MDVLSAMCQPELPLTVHEYEEWGDPRQAEQQGQVGAGGGVGAGGRYGCAASTSAGISRVRCGTSWMQH